jgi:hypothetical protein
MALAQKQTCEPVKLNPETIPHYSHLIVVKMPKHTLEKVSSTNVAVISYIHVSEVTSPPLPNASGQKTDLNGQCVGGTRHECEHR